MSTRILSITLLLLAMCLCAHSAGSWRHPAKKVYPLCCTHVTSVDITSDIIKIDYYGKQTAKGQCVEAIILLKSDGKVCADPKAEWVKKLIANMTLGDL